MPFQSAYQRWICEELESLMNKSRTLQMMLLLHGIDKRIMLDYQTAVDDFRQTSLLVNEWLTAEPTERLNILATAAELRTQAAERSVRGILFDLANGDLPPRSTFALRCLAAELGAPSVCEEQC